MIYDGRAETAGWLVRTKASEVDEGGISAGFSVTDSVLPVDELVERWTYQVCRVFGVG